MNANELSAFLADRAADVAEYLYPNGKRQAGAWKVGNVNGDEGKSLSVILTGTKKGQWRDFATNEGGDLIDLWCGRKGLSIGDAMREIKAHYSIREDSLIKSRQTYKRPEKPKVKSAREQVRDWLHGRGLSDLTIDSFKVAQLERGEAVYAVFPYLRDGEYINGKYRNIAEKKDMRQESGAEPCLFGWHLIDPRQRTVCIAEGEIDAMTLHQVGIPALSVNAGAGNHQWIDNDWERLERFSEIYLCYDNDDAGQKGAREVANRLGLERCKVVYFDGAKDANEALQKGFDAKDFEHALACARPFDPEELRQLADFWPQVKASFWPAPGNETLFPRLHFCGVDFDWFEFRPGEVTVYTGYNGHGKSLILNQALISVLRHGERMCVFSGEMLPVHQGRRMAKQLVGMDRPSVRDLDDAGEWLRDRCWLFNLSEAATLNRLLEVFAYGYRRYGIRHFVIDSLMMTDVPEDGAGAMSAQKDAMRRLATFARSNGVHVHLVAHPRKGDDEKKSPGKMDVAGSGKITDAADNVFSVWADHKEPDERMHEPDACLTLWKQRNGDTQKRRLWLYFNKDAQQFSTDVRRMPYQYIELHAHAEQF